MSDMDAIEIPLPAGRMTAGIVRVGDTVRRPSKPSSPFVAQLLSHLRDCGCEWSPRYLGQDGLGRDILTYVPGGTPGWTRFADAQIRPAATIVRHSHESGQDRGGDRMVGAGGSVRR